MRTCFLSLLLCFSYCSFTQSNRLNTVIQKGHSAVVKTVAYSPNGELMVTGSRDKTAKLWSVASGLEIRTFIGHEQTINDVKFSPDGKRIATSSADKTAKIWDIETGEELWSTERFKNYVTTVSFSADGKRLAVGGYNTEVIIFDIKSKDTIQKFKVNSDRGSGYGVDTDFSKDGRWFAIGQDNRTVDIYETKTWTLIYTMKPKEGWCGGCGSYVTFSPNSQYLTKFSNGGSMEEYRLIDGELHHSYMGEVGEISALAYNKDGSLLLSADEDSVRVFDTKQRVLVNTINPEVVSINKVVFTPDSSSVLVGGNDNKATLWDLFDNTKKGEFSGIVNQINKGGLNYDPDHYWESYIAKYIKYENNVLVTKDGSHFLKGKTGKRAKLIEVRSGNVVMEYVGHDKGVLCFEFSQNESLLLTGGGDGKAILWEKKTGKLLRVFKGHSEPLFDVSFSHDEQKMVTTSWDGYVIVWDLKTGEKLERINLGNVSANRVAFSQNDVYLFISKLDKSFELREIDTKEVARRFVGHTDNITHLVTDFEHQQFLTASKDGSAILWDYNSGLIKRKFKHPKGAVHSAIINQKQIITGGSDRVIRFWDSYSGILLNELKGHQAEVTSLNISQDHKLLISGDLDGVIKFWDLETKKEFFEYIQVGEKDFMVKTTDGYFYATEGAQNNIHFVEKLKVYGANQFFNEFYRPDLIPNAFEHKTNTRNKSMQGMLHDSPPPSLKVVGIKNNDLRTVDLFITVMDNGGGAENLQLFHNGKNHLIDPKELIINNRKKGKVTYKCNVELVGGHNLFTVKSTSKGNIESMPESVDILSDSHIPGGKCYVLAIGINQYKNSKLSLNYAKADAHAFADSVKQKTGAIFSGIEVHTLYDKEATKENILKQLVELSEKVTLNDVFILYYAGHGSVVDDKFYFIPTETVRLYDTDNLKKTAIEAQVLQEHLEQIKALKQVIIMDACQSGQSVELLAQRGAIEEKAIAQLSRSAGIHVLASAGSEQFASEFSSLGHGLFTYALLEGLSGKADGAPKDGKITIYELKSYLDDQVPDLSLRYKGRPQYPFTFSRGHDFPLVIVKE